MTIPCNGPADRHTPGGVFGCTRHSVHVLNRDDPCGTVYDTADTDAVQTGTVNPDGTPHACTEKEEEL